MRRLLTFDKLTRAASPSWSAKDDHDQWRDSRLVNGCRHVRSARAGICIRATDKLIASLTAGNLMRRDGRGAAGPAHAPLPHGGDRQRVDPLHAQHDGDQEARAGAAVEGLTGPFNGLPIPERLQGTEEARMVT